jgi:hypothetical protein
MANIGMELVWKVMHGYGATRSLYIRFSWGMYYTVRYKSAF